MPVDELLNIVDFNGREKLGLASILNNFHGAFDFLNRVQDIGIQVNDHEVALVAFFVEFTE